MGYGQDVRTRKSWNVYYAAGTRLVASAIDTAGMLRGEQPPRVTSWDKLVTASETRRQYRAAEAVVIVHVVWNPFLRVPYAA